MDRITAIISILKNNGYKASHIQLLLWSPYFSEGLGPWLDTQNFITIMMTLLPEESNMPEDPQYRLSIQSTSAQDLGMVPIKVQANQNQLRGILGQNMGDEEWGKRLTAGGSCLLGNIIYEWEPISSEDNPSQTERP